MKVFPRFLTIAGALLIVSAMVAHIISLATPNLARMEIQILLNETTKVLPSRGQENAPAMPGEEHGPGQRSDKASVYFGIWKVCMALGANSTVPMEMCSSWGSSILGTEKTIQKYDWLDSVRGFSITGLVLAVLSVILSNTNAHMPSQRDRRRILPGLICVTSQLAAILILTGSLITAINYDKLPLHAAPRPKWLASIVMVTIKRISLSWGLALDLTSAAVFILAGLCHFLTARAALIEDKRRQQKERCRLQTPRPACDIFCIETAPSHSQC